MRLWFAILLVIGLAFAVLSASVISISYALSEKKAYIAYPVILKGVQSSVLQAVATVISPMVLVADSVAKTASQLQSCSLPINEYTPFYTSSLLAQILDASSGESNSAMQSVGILTAQGAGTSSIVTSDKVSWEFALDTFGLGCSPLYLYCYTDNSNRFYCYCADSNGTITTKLVYNATDDGLTPQEATLFSSNSPAMFTPVFYLVGEFSLTYEKAFRCDPSQPSAYATTFAEKNLGQLSAYMKSLVVGETGLAYIIESSTGFLISTSSSDNVVDSSNNRISALNSSNSLIASSAQFLLSKGSFASFTSLVTYDPTSGLLISAQPAEYGPAQAALGWVSVVVIPQSDYTAWVQENAGWSILAAVIISVFLLVVLEILAYFFIVVPLKRRSATALLSEVRAESV